MEIRRCDKCRAEISLAHIKDLAYYPENIQALKFKVPIMASHNEQNEIRRQEGLDDKDVFDNSIARKEIDLCEQCVVEFASMIKVWLANIEIGAP